MVNKTDSTYYQILSDVVIDEVSSANIHSLLNSIVETVATETRARGCSLLLLTPDGGFLRHMASYGLTEDYIKKGRLSADKSMSGALAGKPIAILDASEDERVQYRDEAMREGIASILCVPMILEGKCLGVLRLYTAEKRHFSNEDIRFVRTAADMGAVALEKAVFTISDSPIPDFDTFRQQMVELEWGRWPGGTIY